MIKFYFDYDGHDVEFERGMDFIILYLYIILNIFTIIYVCIIYLYFKYKHDSILSRVCMIINLGISGYFNIPS